MCLMLHVKVLVHCLEMHTIPSPSFFLKLFFTARTMGFPVTRICTCAASQPVIQELWGALALVSVAVLLPSFSNFLTRCLGLLQR